MNWVIEIGAGDVGLAGGKNISSGEMISNLGSENLGKEIKNKMWK